MKTKRPTPQRLPSGTWRCQVMVAGTRVSVTDEDLIAQGYDPCDNCNP